MNFQVSGSGRGVSSGANSEQVEMLGAEEFIRKVETAGIGPGGFCPLLCSPALWLGRHRRRGRDDHHHRSRVQLAQATTLNRTEGPHARFEICEIRD